MRLQIKKKVEKNTCNKYYNNSKLKIYFLYFLYILTVS